MSIFRFKHFQIQQENAPFKISTDSVLLGAWANVESAKRILDIGTGCGILSLMFAQRAPLANVCAIEIEKQSCEIAKNNFENSKWSERITLQNTSLQEFVQTKKRNFDFIICNPPYFQNSTHNQVAAVTRARQNETLGFEDLATGVEILLSAEGVFALILPNVEAELFAAIAGEKAMFCSRKLVARKKEGNMEALVLTEWSKTIDPKQEEELHIRDKNGNYSAEHLKLTADFYLDKKHKSQ